MCTVRAIGYTAEMQLTSTSTCGIVATASRMPFQCKLLAKWHRRTGNLYVRFSYKSVERIYVFNESHLILNIYNNACVKLLVDR